MKYRYAGAFSGKGPQPHQFVSSLRGITVDPNDCIYAVGDQKVKVFDPEGSYLRGWQTGRPGFSVSVNEGSVYVGQEGQLEIYDGSGKLLDTRNDARLLGRVTAIGHGNDYLLVADALDRCIRRYDAQGRFINNIGKNNRMKGFNIPNGVLDFSVDGEGIIHACNPGKHRVETYTPEGELLGHIGRFDGIDPEGFSGCCNPTNVTLSGEGRIYVTEKAGPRAKVYKREGQLLAVIGQNEFDAGCKNMDLTVDSRGRVLVADTVQLRVHVFVPEGTGG